MNTFNTVEQYNEARKQHDENHAAIVQYCKDNKTNAIPCNVSDTFPYADIVNNDLKTKIEVWEWMNDKPEKYFIYINEKERIATTWTGEILGIVAIGRPYKTNFGDTRVSIDITATNGIRYYGIYYKSAGDYARIQSYKKQ